MSAPAYPAGSANRIILWGRWYDELTRAGRDADIIATPQFALNQQGSVSPNLRSLVDEADIKTGVWRTRPLTSGLWALPLLSNNDQQFGVFGGYKLAAGTEPEVIVEIVENAPTITATQEMVDALNVARTESNAAALGINVGDTIQAIWVGNAAILPGPAPAPPSGVPTAQQVLTMIAGAVEGVRQLPAGGTVGQYASPKSGGGYEWLTPAVGGGGGSTFVDATPDTKGVARLLGGTADAPTVPWSKVTDRLALIGQPATDLASTQTLANVLRDALLDLALGTDTLPMVSIDTAAAAPINSKDTYVDATIAITGVGPLTARAAQVRGRGNTTWLAPKKPYRLRFPSSAPTSLIAGRGPDRDWVLLANYYDPSSIRTLIATDIATRLPGLAWVPRFRPVQLTLNGVYQGIYLLGEHVKIASHRLNLTAMSAADTAGLPLSGAYTMEIDKRGVVDEAAPGFITTRGVHVAHDSPDGTVPAQATYLRDWVQTFENTLFDNAIWLDPTNGYAKYIDRDSWIDWYLLNEVTKNWDSNYYSSCKLYKTRDTETVPGKLHFGPPWDFDNSLGNSFGGNVSASDWYVRATTENGLKPGATWHNRMLRDPAFYTQLLNRWAMLRASLLTSAPISLVIAKHASLVAKHLPADTAKWNYVADTAAEVQTWLADRIAWMDTRFKTPPTAPANPTVTAGTPATSAVLAWTASTHDVAVTKYRIYRDNVVIAETTALTYTDTGRTTGTSYSYRVTALDPAGQESASSTAVNYTPGGASGGGSGSDPASIAGLYAWFRAGDIAGSDDAAVPSWTDRSSAALVASNPTAAAQPTLRTAQINGLPVVRFGDAGVKKVLEAAGNASQPAQSIFAVIRPTSFSTRGTIRGGQGGSLGLCMLTNGKIVLSKTYAFDLAQPTNPLTVNQAAVIGATFSAGSAYAYYLNGAANGSGSHSATLDAGSTFVLGANRVSDAQESFFGDIAELIVYNSVLSASDRAAVTSYLGTKYGIAVS